MLPNDWWLQQFHLEEPEDERERERERERKQQYLLFWLVPAESQVAQIEHACMHEDITRLSKLDYSIDECFTCNQLQACIIPKLDLNLLTW